MLPFCYFLHNHQAAQERVYHFPCSDEGCHRFEYRPLVISLDELCDYLVGFTWIIYVVPEITLTSTITRPNQGDCIMPEDLSQYFLGCLLV